MESPDPKGQSVCGSKTNIGSVSSLLASELPELEEEGNGDLRYLAKSPAAAGPHSIIVTATVSYLRPRQLFQFLPASKQFAKH